MERFFPGDYWVIIARPQNGRSHSRMDIYMARSINSDWIFRASEKQVLQSGWFYNDSYR
jgi:hypothetical protein